MAGRTVHIGNVSHVVTEEHLKGYFSCAGAIHQLVITGDPSNPVRFAFAEYATPEEAQNAVSFLNGTSLAGLIIRVQMAKNPIKRNPSASATATTRTSTPRSLPEQQQPQQPQHQAPQYQPQHQAPQYQPQHQAPQYQPQKPQQQQQHHQYNPQGAYDPLSNAQVNMGQNTSSAAQQQPINAIKLFQQQQEIDRELIARTIYVSGLDSTLQEKNMLDFFQVCGPVTNYRLCGDPNQVSRFAFIEFASPMSAKSALSLHGSMLGRTQLRIVPSKAPIQVPQSMQSLSSEEKSMAEKTIHIGGVDLSVTDHALKDFFESLCGPVTKVSMAGETDQHSTRFAFVEFFYKQSADYALQLNGVVLVGHMLRINPSRTPILSGTLRVTPQPPRDVRPPQVPQQPPRDARPPSRRDAPPRDGYHAHDRRRERDREKDRDRDRRHRDHRGRDRYRDRDRRDSRRNFRSSPRLSPGSKRRRADVDEEEKLDSRNHAPANDTNVTPTSSPGKQLVDDEEDFSEPDDDAVAPIPNVTETLKSIQALMQEEPSNKRKKTEENDTPKPAINLDDYFA